MAKLNVAQSLCAGIDHGGRRYMADRRGQVDVPDAAVPFLKREMGLFEPNRAGARTPGFICQACGFHALIRTCGRCGGTCERPETTIHDQAHAPC